VRVQWLEPRPPSRSLRGSGGNSTGAAASPAASALDEFVEAPEGAIPADSIMCRVYPEAHKGGVWRLRRRDKLRIFRVRVEDKPPVEWLTSHLLPDRIIWSSHPALLKPDISFDFSAEEHLLQQEEDEGKGQPDASANNSTTPTVAENQKRTYSTTLACPWFLLLLLSLALATGGVVVLTVLLHFLWSVFKRVARLLNEAPAVLVMAGAGMGKDSGLPDYRSCFFFLLLVCNAMTSFKLLIPALPFPLPMIVFNSSRGAQGFWRSYPPLAKLGITFNESMDPRWFQKVSEEASCLCSTPRHALTCFTWQDPQQAWGFYGHRAQLYSDTTPHAGYLRYIVFLSLPPSC
jgi:hypothetical protein